MKAETRQQYISQAKHFFKSHLESPDNPHIYDVKDALEKHAIEDKPGKASWNKKRRALVVYYEALYRTDEAKFIGMTKFPADAQKTKPPRQAKKVSDEDSQALIIGCISKKTPDSALAGALTVARITGCRPAEMMSIYLLGNNKIFIEGAKKTEDGKKGLDRELILTPKDYRALKNALHYMKLETQHNKPGQTNMAAVNRLQKRLARLTKKLWPRRKRHITLYSFRHQMGSNLKSSGMDRPQIAAIMGHQSVDSVNKYGDRRSGKGSVTIKATQASIDTVRVKEVKNADFKDKLVSEEKRKPDKQKSVTKPAYVKTKINGTTAYMF